MFSILPWKSSWSFEFCTCVMYVYLLQDLFWISFYISSQYINATQLIISLPQIFTETCEMEPLPPLKLFHEILCDNFSLVCSVIYKAQCYRLCGRAGIQESAWSCVLALLLSIFFFLSHPLPPITPPPPPPPPPPPSPLYQPHALQSMKRGQPAYQHSNYHHVFIKATGANNASCFWYLWQFFFASDYEQCLNIRGLPGCIPCLIWQSLLCYLFHHKMFDLHLRHLTSTRVSTTTSSWCPSTSSWCPWCRRPTSWPRPPTSSSWCPTTSSWSSSSPLPSSSSSSSLPLQLVAKRLGDLFITPFTSQCYHHQHYHNYHHHHLQYLHHYLHCTIITITESNIILIITITIIITNNTRATS